MDIELEPWDWNVEKDGLWTGGRFIPTKKIEGMKQMDYYMMKMEEILDEQGK